MAGRQSAAEYLTPVVQLPVSRPDPPDELSPTEASEWRAIVNRMPVDWFPRETHPMLEQLCYHIVAARGLRKRRASARDLDVLLELGRQLREESRAITTLERAMRLTQHSRQDPKRSTGATQKKPWEK